MSDRDSEVVRDRIAEVALERLNASGIADERWRMSMAGSIANRLIAAGATVDYDAKAAAAFQEYLDKEDQ